MGTDVYVYVPTGYTMGGDTTGAHSLDPAFDHDPGDDFTPCADNAPEDFVLTQAQIDRLGDQLTDQIVRVDEEQFGELGLADPDDPASDALVTVVYTCRTTPTTSATPPATPPATSRPTSSTASG